MKCPDCNNELTVDNILTSQFLETSDSRPFPIKNYTKRAYCRRCGFTQPDKRYQYIGNSRSPSIEEEMERERWNSLTPTQAKREKDFAKELFTMDREQAEQLVFYFRDDPDFRVDKQDFITAWHAVKEKMANPKRYRIWSLKQALLEELPMKVEVEDATT